jgi:hypothetical protein
MIPDWSGLQLLIHAVEKRHHDYSLPHRLIASLVVAEELNFVVLVVYVMPY